MRILHVNKYLYRRGGAEAYMLDAASRQRERGHEVDFFAMSHPENEPARFARLFPSEIELDPPPSGMREQVRAAQRMLWSPLAQRRIEQAARELRPDVAHLHNIYHQLSPSVVRGLRRAGVPMVMTLHDYKLVCPSYQMLAGGEPCNACVGSGTRHAVVRRCKGGSLPTSALLAAESAIHRRLDAYGSVQTFLCPSEFLASQMIAGGCDTDRLRVLNNPIDDTGIPHGLERRDIVVYAGRLSPEKGVDTAIRALARVEGVRLEIAGEGPERADLEALAHRIAPGRVTFHGRLDRPETLKLIGSARALVLPARWHENQPIAVLESLACGVPVLTTHLGGLPELVSDRQSGRIVGPDDPDALAGAIEEVRADPDRAALWGAEGRARVRARHGMEQHLDALEASYQAAATSSSSVANVAL